MLTLFDNLADLSLIDIFSYLSCTDALWSFSNLNTRITTLLIECGCYRHINLSSSRYHQFQTFLSLLKLNEIESLVVDCYASSLQLRNWPYLSHLRILIVKNGRDFIDIFNFAYQHAKTLTHLTIESSAYSQGRGIAKKMCYPSWNLFEFTAKVLRRLPALRSLKYGMESSFYIHQWPFKIIPIPLIYLKITIRSLLILLNIMSTKPLAQTLQQLHIKLSGSHSRIHESVNIMRKVLPKMEVLHTFTFIKTFEWHSILEWAFLNELTCVRIMPVLRRMNFSIIIKFDDLARMSRSAVFTDYRRVDIHYAFIIIDDRSHKEISEYVPHGGNRSHLRQIASATFIAESWPDNQLFITPNQYYMEKSKNRQHLFYTLPWAFNEFAHFCVPDRCINELIVFTSSKTNTIYSSRLTKLNLSDDLQSPIRFLPHLMSSNQTVELHLYRCTQEISLNLPIVSHLVLTDSLNSLHNCLFLTKIRSIQITLHYECLQFAGNDWTAMRRLSNLPLLNSLHILLYDMRIPPDDISCYIIAEIAPLVSDFFFCFRRISVAIDYDVDLVYKKQSLFVKQLGDYIVGLSLNEERCISYEKDGCGIIIWF